MEGQTDETSCMEVYVGYSSGPHKEGHTVALLSK